MRWIVSIVIIFLAIQLLTPRAHAIIFLPALLLIPIAKIVALIMAGFSFPALGLGVLWSKLFKKSLKRTIFVTIALLFLLAVILFISFKLHNPDRPWF